MTAFCFCFFDNHKIRSPHSERGRRGNAPARPSRRRFSLRFIEKKNGGGTIKKALAFLFIKQKTEFVKIYFFVNLVFYRI